MTRLDVITLTMFRRYIDADITQYRQIIVEETLIAPYTASSPAMASKFLAMQCS